MINDDILVIANQASLKISANEKVVVIQQKYRLADKSIWGVLLFLIGGVFFIFVPFIKASDTASKILGVVIGLLFLTISIFTLIRQASDSLKITNREIMFRYNLKQTSILLNPSLKIKMKTEIREIRRVGTIGSAFILVTHYLQTIDNEIPILNFQMDNSNTEKAIMLGNEITRIINNKFRQFN